MTEYEEHQYENRESILACPKCGHMLTERWFRNLKKLDKGEIVPRKNHKPVSVWCDKCKYVLSDIKQPKQC